jgi:hypothetical protein
MCNYAQKNLCIICKPNGRPKEEGVIANSSSNEKRGLMDAKNFVLLQTSSWFTYVDCKARG